MSEKELLEKALATSTEAMSRAWLRITDLERELTSYQIAKDNLELRLIDEAGDLYRASFPAQVY